MATRKKTTKTSKKAQGGSLDVRQRSDMPIISIESKTDESQLLITLRRVPQGGGASQWLSPVGWVDSRKSTLLDCYETDAGCEVIIPDSYADILEQGDQVHISCSTINLRGQITWKVSPNMAASNVEAVSNKIDMTALKTDESSEASGLMSRFLSKKAKPVSAAPLVSLKPEPTDAERRAEDAQKLADDYREQMEKASAAREAAQKRALEAAKKAEDALQAETARIAEMERVAKAYAEAEAKRQDEERRLEAERRAEQLRLEEEARLAEEARQKELAKIRAAERAEEKTRLLTLQEEASNKRAELAETLEKERSALHRLMTDRQANLEQLDELENQLPSLETDLSLLAQNLNEKKAGINALSERLEIATTKLSEANTVKAQHAERIAEALSDFEMAQAEAEAAIARAEALKVAHLDLVEQEGDMSSRFANTQKTLTSIKAEQVDVQKSVSDAQAAYDGVQNTSEQTRSKIEALTLSKTALVNDMAEREATIDQLNHALNAALSEQDAAQAAISLLDEGGDVKAAREIVLSVQENAVETPSQADLNNVLDIAEKPAATLPKFKGLLKPKRAVALSSSNVAELVAKDIDDTETVKKGDTPERSVSSIVAAQIAANENNGLSSSQKKYAGLGVAAIALSVALGFGWSAMTRPDVQQTVEVKTTPSTVLTAQTSIEAPALPTHSIVEKTNGSELAETGLDLKPAATKVAEAVPTIKPAPIKVKTDVPQIVEVERKHTSVNVAAIAKKVSRKVKADIAKEAKAKRLAVEKTKAVKKVAVKPKPKAAMEKQIAPAPKVKRVAAAPIVKEAALRPITITPIETSQRDKADTQKRALMSPAVTRTVQSNLKILGYYDGQIHGAMSDSLQEAAELFNTIYSRPKSDVFTAAFVRSLQEKAAEVRALPVKTAALTVPTSRRPTTGKVEPKVVEVKPEPIEVAPSVTNIAAISAVQTPPVANTIQDDVVKAVAIKPMRARYPSRAARNNVYEDVVVEITYDISIDGKVENANVVSNSLSGRYASAFEKEALRGAKASRFKPKTINGQVVATRGLTKRIRFRAE